MEKRLVTIAAVIIFFNILFVNFSLADLSVRPAKLGIIRLTVSQFFPGKATGSLEVGNTYNHSILISVSPSTNIANIVSLSESSFTLQPNETKKVDYEVTVTEPGTYIGNVQITAKSIEKTAWVGYQADIAIIATKSNFDLNILIAAGVLIFLIVLVTVYFKVLKKRKKGKRALIAAAFCLLFLFFSSSNVLASNVAMVVKNATALSPEHEQGIYDILTDMGHNVTLVDQSIDVNYFDYNLIVVAGRPLGSSSLDDFVNNIPVNKIPTIGIDYSSLDNWGWVGMGGRSSLLTNQALNFYVRAYHPIVQGFSPGDVFYARTVPGYKAVDMVYGGTNFTFVGTTDANGQYGIVAYALPRTILANGDRIADDSAAIFIGVNYPIYWSDQMVQIFRNSVNWLLNLEFDPPTDTVLSGPSTAKTSAAYSWTSSSDESGIRYYQFQLSSVPDFSSTTINTYVDGLKYTASGLKDGTVYYARVRAIDNINVPGSWSNVVKTISDSTNIILKINSPADGTVLHLNDTVIVDVDINAQRLPDGGICTITIGGEFIANITYNKTSGKCSDSVIIPMSLSSKDADVKSFTVSATNSIGSTNSTSVTVFMSRPLYVNITTDKGSYNIGENITFSGYVTLSDNGAKVNGSLVSYSVAGMFGNKKTNSNGYFSFIFNNLTDGTYTALINATYLSLTANSSVSFGVVAPPNSAVAPVISLPGLMTGGIAILSVNASDSINVNENSDQQILVRVKNEGTGLIHSVKLVVSGIEADVSPNLVDIDANKYIDFRVTLHVPAGTGEKQITLKAMGYEATRTKKITLTVLPQILFPVLKIDSIELPTFSEGEQATVYITVKNIGNATANTSYSIELPTGWVATESQKIFEIPADSQQKVSFDVIPSNESGQIVFNVSYIASDQEKHISEIKDVVSNPRQLQQEQLSLTGMFTSAIVSPEFFVPALLVSFLILAFFIGKKGLIKPLRGTNQNVQNFSSNAPRRSANPNSNYLEWERKKKRH